MNQRIPKNCEVCGTEYLVKRSQLEKSRFCSRDCQGIDKSGDVLARFLSNVQKTDSCWLWTGTKNRQGYGRFSARGPVSAHRWAFEHFHGPIPDGLIICHSCDTPRCVNPDHLFLGNNHTNTMDAVIKGRHVRGERCHTAKITEDQVRTIRRRHALEGVSQAQLGREFGVRDRLIGRVIRRECWKHVA